MLLENTFTVPAGIDEAWAALNDPSRVAPCFPGATLTGTEGDTFTGTVKIKLGSISLTYKGQGTFIRRDASARTVVIEASGRAARSNSTANATITGTLTANGEASTSVTMVTDLTVTGRPAQFDHGMLAEVSGRIVGQLSSCLATKLGPGAEAAKSPEPSDAAGAAPKKPTVDSAPKKPSATVPQPTEVATSNQPAATVTPASAITNGSPVTSTASDVEPTDELDTAAAPVLKRLAPVLLGLIALVVALRLIKTRKS